MNGCQSFSEPVLSTLLYNQKVLSGQDYLIIQCKCNVKSVNYQIIDTSELKINRRDTFCVHFSVVILYYICKLSIQNNFNFSNNSFLLQKNTGRTVQFKMDEITIKTVWEKMKLGDEKSLSRIFTFFYSDLYQYGIKIFDLPDLVKDSIQDVFVRIWEKRSTIGEVQNPKAYLLSSVRRKLFSNHEIQKAELSDEIIKKAGKENFSFSPSEFMEIEEISVQLRNSLVQSINNLPERQRELIFLRFYYNLRYAEIAQIMGANEQTIRNLMQRALAKLREKIDRKLWEDIDLLDELLLSLFLLFQKKN